MERMLLLMLCGRKRAPFLTIKTAKSASCQCQCTTRTMMMLPNSSNNSAAAAAPISSASRRSSVIFIQCRGVRRRNTAGVNVGPRLQQQEEEAAKKQQRMEAKKQQQQHSADEQKKKKQKEEENRELVKRELRERRAAIKAAWARRKTLLAEMQALQKELDELKAAGVADHFEESKLYARLGQKKGQETQEIQHILKTSREALHLLWAKRRMQFVRDVLVVPLAAVCLAAVFAFYFTSCMEKLIKSRMHIADDEAVDVGKKPAEEEAATNSK